MALNDEAARRERMVARQIEARGVRDARVLQAMREVPRHAFVPAALAESAYDDRALPIAAGQTISQPYVVALMLEALALRPAPAHSARSGLGARSLRRRPRGAPRAGAPCVQQRDLRAHRAALSAPVPPACSHRAVRRALRGWG